MTDPITVTIIGAGMSGIAQAIALKQSLGPSVKMTIFERSHAPGGVWRDSKWPGAGVDIPIHLYSLWNAPKADWSRVYAEQPEVLRYLTGLIEEHDLSDYFVYNTTYLSSTWNPQTCIHTIQLQPSDSPTPITHTSQILISANGPLSSPLIPRIPGRESFQGPAFHNLNWDSTIDFQNKKVAVIGNGSSGIQFIPGLSEIEGCEVVQFIRSGGYYFPKINTEFTKWEKTLFKYLPGYRLVHRLRIFLAHNDRWDTRNYEEGEAHEKAEQTLLKYLKDNAPEEYLDALIPKYPLGCKRPAFDAGWLASLHKPNVSLNGDGISRITSTSIVTTKGWEYKPDVIVYATGADVGRHGVGLNIGLRGEGGKELREYWEGIGGPQGYLGLSVPGFPNYFMALGPNAVAGSWGFTIGNQTATIARIVREMREYGIRSMQPKKEVFELHNTRLQEKLTQSTMASTLCTSWWRMSGSGRISVPNSLNAIGLWKETRTTNWNDWITVGQVGKGEKADLGVIDVSERVRRKRAKQIASISALAAAVALVYPGWSNLYKF